MRSDLNLKLDVTFVIATQSEYSRLISNLGLSILSEASF